MVPDIGERVEHPLLVVLLIVGVLLFIVAYAADVAGMQWTAGFVGIYAVVVVASSLAGYLFLAGLDVASRIKERRHDPAS